MGGNDDDAVAVMMVRFGDADAVPKSFVENDRWGRLPWMNEDDDRLRNTMAAVQDLFASAI